MNIDIKTLILVIGIVYLVQFFVFLNQYLSNRNISGPGWWQLWSATGVLGFFFILLRPIPSFNITVIAIQNVVIVIGAIFIYIGVKRFFGKKVDFILISISVFVFALLHNYFFLINDNIIYRTFLFALFLLAIAFLTAFEVYRNITKNISTSAYFIIGVLIVHGSIFLYRVITILLGMPVADMFQSSFFNIVQFFDALIISLLWTFGFIMMLNQKLNAEIIEAKTHFEQIFNTSPDAIVLSRFSDGQIVSCNDGFLKISGYTKEEVIGKTTTELNLYCNPKDRDNILSKIKESGEVDNMEVLFQKKSNEIIIGLISVKTTMISGIMHFISVTRSITHLRSTESELKIKNKQLETLNEEKNKFFSIIAHDLRSPFSSIVSLSDLMIEQIKQKDYQDVERYAGMISKSSERAMALLSNLMQWAQKQTGRMNFTPEFFELSHLIDDTIILFDESISQKSIQINKQYSSKILVFADLSMLAAIMRNLISNAIKFSGQDSLITVTVVQNNIEFCVSVADKGIGISENMLDKLFKISENFSTDGTQGEQGTGLGLILCKEFVEMHNGKIWFESVEGKGSTFYFSIPQDAFQQ